MKLTSLFKLNPKSIEFLNVWLNADNLIYVNANKALGKKKYLTLLLACNTFWQATLDKLKIWDVTGAQLLRWHLHEPNETRLGMSAGKPTWKWVGEVKAGRLIESITKSAAVKSGKIRDLQDVSLFVEWVGPDNSSDIVTNVWKKYFIDYTLEQCALHNIPLKDWYKTRYRDHKSSRWVEGKFALPYDIVQGKYILFVPKELASRGTYLSNDRIYKNVILEYEKQKHLNTDSELVETRKVSKERFIKKWKLKAHNKQFWNGKENTERVLLEDNEIDIMELIKSKLLSALSIEDSEFGGDKSIQKLWL